MLKSRREPRVQDARTAGRRIFYYDPRLDTCVVEELPVREPEAPLVYRELAGTRLLSVGCVCCALLAAATFVIAAAYPDAQGVIYSATLGTCAALASVLMYAVERHLAALPNGAEHPSGFALLGGALRTLNQRKTFADAMLRRALDILVALLSVGVVFCLLQAWIQAEVFPDTATATVSVLETTAIRLSNSRWVHALLKPNKFYQLLFVTVAAILAAQIPILARLDLIPRWKRFARWMWRTSVVLTAITSITFFGEQQSKTIRAGVARFREKAASIARGYSALQKDADLLVAQVAAQEIAAHRLAPVFPRLEALQREYADARETAAKAAREGITVTPPEYPVSARHYRRWEPEGQSPNEEVLPAPQWSEVGAGELKHDLSAASSEIRAEAQKSHPIVDEGAEVIYDQVFRATLDPILRGAGIESDLLKVLVEPVTKTLGSEFLKRQARALFDRAAGKLQSVREAREQARREIDARLVAGVAEDPAGLNNIDARIAELRTPLQGFRAEVRRQINNLAAAEVASFRARAERASGGLLNLLQFGSVDRIARKVEERAIGADDPFQGLQFVDEVSRRLAESKNCASFLASLEQQLDRTRTIPEVPQPT